MDRRLLLVCANSILMLGSFSEATQAYDGPEKRPDAPSAKDGLKGEVKSIDLDSKHLNGTRNVKVYLPPDHDPQKSYPVIYAADALDGVACELIEPLITSGEVPPLIIVGVACGPGGMRQAEYMPNVSPKHFKAHEKFFLEEVMPWAEQEWGASKDRKDRVIYGSSNSGPFALTIPNRHPEMFGHVFATMVYGLRFADFESELEAQPDDPTRYILMVGSLDAHGIEENQQVEEILKKKGFPVSSSIIEGGGHTHQLQKEQLPGMVKATFGNQK